MAKNRFAQPLYGKIIYIYETDLQKEDLSTIFDPSTYWIDVTGLDCEVGYLVDFKENVGLVLTPPPNEILTFEEEKEHKIAQMKAERDAREVEPIQYNEIILDYDDKARERMRIAEKALTDNSLPNIVWTCADNTRALLTVQDFINVNTIAAQRSNELHTKYNELKDYIETIKDTEELESVYFDMIIPEKEEETEGTEEPVGTEQDDVITEILDNL